MIFYIENSLRKSNFGTSRRGGKASRDTYNQGRRLIFQDLLKNWVAKGVASQVNYFSMLICTEGKSLSLDTCSKTDGKEIGLPLANFGLQYKEEKFHGIFRTFIYVNTKYIYVPKQQYINWDDIADFQKHISYKLPTVRAPL